MIFLLKCLYFISLRKAVKRKKGETLFTFNSLRLRRRFLTFAFGELLSRGHDCKTFRLTLQSHQNLHHLAKVYWHMLVLKSLLQITREIGRKTVNSVISYTIGHFLAVALVVTGHFGERGQKITV